MRSFAREAEAALSEIEQAVRAAQDDFRALLRFLGYSDAEASSLSSEEFFGALTRFLDRLRSAVSGANPTRAPA
eukprot:ctg_1898.g310